jgi:hypothetical protein
MSQLERIIEHLLKLEHSRNAERRRQWMIAVNSARGEIARRMTPRSGTTSSQRFPTCIGARVAMANSRSSTMGSPRRHGRYPPAVLMDSTTCRPTNGGPRTVMA